MTHEVIGGSSSPRILVVDDNAINAVLARRLLEKLGCVVACAESGERAVEAVESAPFDAILMDVQMPGMDGIEATRRIRSRERERGAPRVPICALTAHVRAVSEADCLGAGMDGYQLKPFDLRALRATLERLLPARAEATPPAPSRDALSTRFGGDPSVVDEVVGLFLERSPALVDKLRAALDGGDAGEVERAAHTLKGTLLTFGADPAAGAAEAIEAAARTRVARADLLAPLVREMDRLTAHLRTIAAPEALP